jgi:hypothetical protein
MINRSAEAVSQLRNARARARLLVPAGAAVAVIAAALAVWLPGHGDTTAAARPAPPAPAPQAPGTIMTVAGGVGGPGPATSVPITTCPISYADGALYAGDEEVVRRIDARTGWLTTPAGDGTYSDHGDGGLATGAGLNAGNENNACTTAATLDAAGNLLIAAGQIYVVAARTGTFYGRPMTARHIYPIPSAGAGASGVLADRAGNLVTITTGSPPCGDDCSDYPGLVQVLAERTGTLYGRTMVAGHFYTLAGNEDGTTRTGNGGPGIGAGLGSLAQVALDQAGNLLIADEGNTGPHNKGGIPPEIRVLAASTGTFYGQRMTAGYIYSIAGGGHLTGNGVPATRALIGAQGVAHDSAGNVIIGDGNELRVVAARTGRFYGQRMTAGDIYTVAGTGSGYRSYGDGGPALRAHLYAEFVAVDGAGNLVFTDGDSSKIRVVAERTGTFYGVAMRAGDIYSVAGTGGAVASDSLGGAPAGVASDGSGDLIIGQEYGSGAGPEFVPARPGTYFGAAMRPGRLYRVPLTGGRFGRCPGGVATDRFGNVLIADQASNRVLVAPVRSGRFYGQWMRAGRIYPVAGNGKAHVSGDGGPALAAGLNPAEVASDRRGDIFVIDAGFFQAGSNSHTPVDRILMVPARSGTFYGVRMTAGHIYAVAGNGNPSGPGEPPIGDAVPATHTSMSPFGVTVDAAGNLVLASDDRVRVVALRTGRFYGMSMKAGYIYTVAGPFPGSHAVAVDRHGNIIVDDASANVVRLVAEASGTFYGQRVIAGHDYVIAGHAHGPAGLGENGPATKAWLDGPDAVAVAPDGRLLIAESGGQRIQAVMP